MIHVIDANSGTHTHVVFNASMIKVIRSAYPDHDIAFYASAPHQERVKDYLDGQEVSRLKFFPFEARNIGRGKIGKLTKVAINTVADLILFSKIFAAARKNPSDKVIIFKAHPASLLMVKYLKVLYRKLEVMAVMHGEIEFIYFANDSWEKRIASIYKRIVAVRVPNFKYILLNKISKHRLIQDGYLKPEEIVEIDHPYLYSTGTDAIKPPSWPIRISQIGSLGLRKNAHLIYCLAERHAEDIANGLLRFITVGPIDDDALLFKNSFVKDFTGKSENGYISRQIFINESRKAHYAVFFYGPTQFIFRASGSLMDVIDLCKPVIALKHPFFTYMTNEVGDVGFLCDNLDEMSSIISRLASGEATMFTQYEVQCANLRKFKQMHGIASIASDFLQQAH